MGVLCIRIYLGRRSQNAIHMRSTTTTTDSSIQLLISSADQNLLKCSLETWLRERDDFFIFTNYKTQSAFDRVVFQKFNLYNHWALIRSQSLYVSQFLRTKNEPDWYVFASDNSLVLINQLKLELSGLDSTHAYYTIISEKDEEKTEPPNSLVPITILSRGALSMLMRQIRSQSPGCGIDEGSLSECLEQSVNLNLQRDSQKRNRFLIIKRHFAVSEMNDFKQANGALK
ncbi:unnamed protein product [Auanema sp. JU1783]|nr:unnamed protein product [Auanema sp. JU1783]